MNTYGFHTIHGRAPAVATGLALARPDLQVWVITGDGDGLSIGGNHLIHALRRNINLKILLFNNQTYGLTKGQYSPTSTQGTVSKSTPFGSVDRPFSPLSLAVGAGATFVARTYDKNQKHMASMFKRATKHSGTAFIEIYQNCVIFNKDVFDDRIGKDVSQDNLLFVEDGEPLLFGKERNHGLEIKDMLVRKINLENNNREQVHIHKEDSGNRNYAFLMSQLEYPEYPQPMGVLYTQNELSHDEKLINQNNKIKKSLGLDKIDSLLKKGETWEI